MIVCGSNSKEIFSSEYNSIKENLEKTKKIKEEIEFIKETLEETDEVLDLAEEEITKQ